MTLAAFSSYLKLEGIPCHCGHMHGWDYYAQERHGFHITVRICEMCGTARTSPYPTPDTLSRFYAQDYRTLYTPGGPEDAWKNAVATGQHIASVIPAQIVYDIGTGSGGALHAYHEAGARVFGCDLGAEFLEYAREKLPNATITHGSEEVLEDGMADVVMAIHTLEHRVDIRDALVRHARKLAPGGTLVVVLPVLMSVLTHYRSFRNYLQIAHVWHFTHRTFQRLCHEVGMSCEGTQDGLFFCRPQPALPTTPDPMAAVDTLHWWQLGFCNVEGIRYMRRCADSSPPMSRARAHEKEGEDGEG